MLRNRRPRRVVAALLAVAGALLMLFSPSVEIGLIAFALGVALELAGLALPRRTARAGTACRAALKPPGSGRPRTPAMGRKQSAETLRVVNLRKVLDDFVGTRTPRARFDERIAAHRPTQLRTEGRRHRRARAARKREVRAVGARFGG